MSSPLISEESSDNTFVQGNEWKVASESAKDKVRSNMMEHFEVELAGDEVAFVSDENVTQLLSKKNIAIPVFYFMLGFLLKFPYVALRQYLRLELEEPPSIQILVFTVVMTLPWNFKMLYAFVSDCFPIYGMRRKPYMLFGTILCSLCWFLLGILDRPNLSITCLLTFTATFGMVLCDVMADTLVVERMKYEKGADVGNMQSACWICRFTGSLTGFLLGGWLMTYADVSPQTIFVLNGLIPPSPLLPALLLLHDTAVESSREHVVDEMKQKLGAVWGAVQQKHIWQPMILVFLFAATPSNADGFANFILGPLKFSEDQYTYILSVGMFASAMGAWIYRRWLKNVGLRKLFASTLIGASLLSSSQLVLIFRVNKCWGVSDFLFAFGDEVVVDTASFILQMPLLVLCAKLCPPGVESTVYALTTVVNNIALTVGGSISSALTKHYHITLTDFSNLWIMTVIACTTSLFTLVGVPFVPNRPDEVHESPRSRIGGGLLLGILLSGLLWSTGHAIHDLSQSTGGSIHDDSDEGVGDDDGGADATWVFGPIYNCSTGLEED